MKLFNTIDSKELDAAACLVADVCDGQRALSGYVGSSPTGGLECMALQQEWENVFKIKHAVAVNSATSGLLAACMAVGVQANDEVIVSPYTMSATAAAPKLLGATIIWADIEPDTFCIDPLEVANKISPKTKAVIATNLFGHPARLHELRALCDQHGVYLIEDNAQAIFAKENGVYTGTIGHIGVFSLNVHKHLQVGEGGVCVTNNDTLAGKMREAMNHGEMRGGILGLNLRMTEVTAAMARAQLAKGPATMKSRDNLAMKIYQEVDARKLPILLPIVRYGCSHSFYCWAGLLKREPAGDLPAPFKRGYLRPLYELPAFKGKIPFSLDVVEEVERDIILVEVCSIDPTDSEIIQMVEALGRAL